MAFNPTMGMSANRLKVSCTSRRNDFSWMSAPIMRNEASTL